MDKRAFALRYFSVLLTPSPMTRYCAVLILLLGMCSCSSVSLVTLYNNSNTTVVFCNLHARNNRCQTIPSHALVRTGYLSRQDSRSWDFRISSGATSRIFSVPVEMTIWKLRSTHYCYFPQGCDVPIQLEPDGLLYWVGTAATMPIQTFPPQPAGFPIRGGI